MPTLILLRHGQSEWNQQNLFTGWYNCDLTNIGIKEALQAGKLLDEAGLIPDVTFSSLQKRAIKTAELVNQSLNREIPIHKNWRLNERHYGDLTGLNKSDAKVKFGEEKIQEWRRGYHTPPPPISPENNFNPNTDDAYANVPKESIPLTECLADVVDRLIPYWNSDISKDLRSGKKVLVAAHGNSLRALCKHLDKIDDKEIVKLNIPTGIPFIYDLDEELNPLIEKPVLERALDPKTAQTQAESVKKQTQ
ncbi:MAG TPA: 2,3-diphosphoglycerate-dependent phosphoglycerate mutase [Acidimicrobiales bacterium]|jgi:2,3-bisphosphoglycerate-dependent phosphoglycerate mutase|nr:2,3-diphosphoglycerate-dependent phosphoglycerate mutase [Acidimicrobiales bacterium]